MIIIHLLWKKISKDYLVLTCGVAFLEIEWTSGSLFLLIAVSIKQNIILFIIKRNKLLSG
jgi:hypothetical protein